MPTPTVGGSTRDLLVTVEDGGQDLADGQVQRRLRDRPRPAEITKAGAIGRRCHHGDRRLT